MKLVTRLSVILSLVTVLGIFTTYSTPYADAAYDIPDWVENLAGMWYSGVINDDAFGNALDWLINNDILTTPNTSTTNTNSIGSTFTNSLAIGLNKPFVPINHLEGHLLSTTFNNKVEYPHIAFLLTGGHTQIYLIKSINNYILLGETLDDAVGEAFDKVAKLLKMSYPGGPEIENKAKSGNKSAFSLPQPLYKNKSLDFSFSGIRT